MPTKWIVAVVDGYDEFWSEYDTEEEARVDYERDVNSKFRCVTLAKVVSSESCK